MATEMQTPESALMQLIFGKQITYSLAGVA
jgi:hypothetical protein